MAQVNATTKNRLFMLLLGNGLVSFGGWIDYIVILTLSVFYWKADQYDVALIGAVTLLPGIVLSKPIGMLVSSHYMIHWLRVSLLLRALCTVVLLMATSLQGFIIVAVMRATFNSIALPAISVLSANSVPKKERNHYYSVLNMINSAAKMIGPALGSALSVLLSDTYTLLFSGFLTFLGFIVFCCIGAQRVSSLGIKKANITQAQQRLYGTAWYAYVGVIFIYFAMVFMVNNQLPVILSTMKMNKQTLGMLVSASAIGNFLYGFWRVKKSKHNPLTGKISELLMPAMSTMVCFVIISVCFFYFDLLHIETLLLCFFLIGMVSACFFISSNIYLVTHFNEQIGIASGWVQSVQNLAMLVAPFVGAFVLSHTSSGGKLFLLSGVVGLCCLLGIRMLVKSSLSIISSV
ncbi:MFS transporter [Bartonella queenslandensis]|uniref:MFS transporter n=1 Tax=Bartonella queenslandensis TaxID=481138 RepID=UPI001BAD31D5|nr:MFS transporter [Bartonella queenslandensis]